MWFLTNLEAFSWKIKSHLQTSMHKDSKSKTWPNPMLDTCTMQRHKNQNLEAAKTSKPNLRKTWKSLKLKPFLEADSKQNLNTILLLDIHWVCSNQKQGHSPPQTHCKWHTTSLWTCFRVSRFTHHSKKLMTYLQSPNNFHDFHIVWLHLSDLQSKTPLKGFLGFF